MFQPDKPMIATQKIIDEAYSHAHVSADITEKMAAKPEKARDIETASWLLTEARNLYARANALHSRATGNKPETIGL